LTKFFKEAFSLVGTPITLELKPGKNPFKDKKNTLTKHQEERRTRFQKIIKKAKKSKKSRPAKNNRF